MCGGWMMDGEGMGQEEGVDGRRIEEKEKGNFGKMGVIRGGVLVRTNAQKSSKN